MNRTSFIAKINKLLQSTEMFTRPSKQIPAKWQLFEYYFDEPEKLNRVTEEQLKTAKQSWIIEFTEDGRYIHNSNLSVQFIAILENGTWSVSKNFIALIHPKDFRKNVEFQFAIDKGILKLLRKDKIGKIDFFGFFRKLD